MFLFGKKDYFKPGPDGTAPVIAFVGKTITVPVYDVPAAVGREKGQVDVLINDATVSRKHLLISTYGDKLTVTDQGSTVGTVINGEVLEPGVPYYLSDGDKVSIGKLDFVCHINRERTGKKLKLPTFIQKDTAGDTSEMSKADIAAAAAEFNDGAEEQAPDLGSAAEVVKNAEQASGLKPAAEVVKDAEQASGLKPAAGVVKDAEQASGLEPAAEVVKDAELAGQASEPVIKLMKDPILEELQDDEPESKEQDTKHNSASVKEPDPGPVINLMKGPEFDEAEETNKAGQYEPDGTEGTNMAGQYEPDGSYEPDEADQEAPGAPGYNVELNQEAPEGNAVLGQELPDGSSKQDAAKPEDNPGDPVSELEAMGETIDVMREHAPSSRPKFVYYSGHTAVETFEITATPFVVGRARSDYTPGAAGVSRRHCFIDRTGSTYYITDLESTNGVWINGRRIKPYNRTALENGDIIGIGDRVYKFEQE